MNSKLPFVFSSIFLNSLYFLSSFAKLVFQQQFYFEIGFIFKNKTVLNISKVLGERGKAFEEVKEQSVYWGRASADSAGYTIQYKRRFVCVFVLFYTNQGTGEGTSSAQQVIKYNAI